MRSIAMFLGVAAVAVSIGCQRPSTKHPDQEQCIRRDQPIKVAALGYRADHPAADGTDPSRPHSNDPLGTNSPDRTERQYFKEKDNSKNELRDQPKEFELPDCPPLSQ